MGVANYSNNTTQKIAGAVGAGYTPAGNEYVEASYSGSTVSSGLAITPFTLKFGPGQTVPGSYTVPTGGGGGIACPLVSGVLFRNTP